MCIPGLFGSGKQQAMTPPTITPLPMPAPLPTVSQSQTAVQDYRTVARDRLRYGLASTIKTPLGTTASLIPINGQSKATLG